MPNSSLKIDLRRQRILEILRGEGRVFVTQLGEQLGVTAVTIRNDLSALERDGLLTRVPGGAVPLARPAQAAAVPADDGGCAAEKRAIAARLAEMVRDGDRLFLNSGTTVLAVAAALKRRQNLHIVTNSLAAALLLGGVPTFHVLLLGGEINAQYGFVTGSDTMEQLNRYRADWAVLTVDSLSAAGGVTTYNPDEAALNQRMIERAARTVIVADHRKIGGAGFARFHWADASICLITDAAAPQEELRRLEGRGVEIHTC